MMQAKIARGEQAGGSRALPMALGASLLAVALLAAQAAGGGGAPVPAPTAVSGETAGPGPAEAPAAAPRSAPPADRPPVTAQPAAAQPATAPGAAPARSFNNDYALLLGIQYWNKVDDFDPAIPPGTTGRAGRVDPAGLGLEGSYHRRVARWPGWELFAGGDLGVFYHPNKEEFQVTILPSGRRIDGELLTRGLYLMPSVKLFTGEPAPWRYSLGAGAGYVLVDFSTQLDDGMTVDTYFREETLGWYLSAGADRLLGGGSMSILLRLEAKVLFADFGSLGEFAPGAGSLTGPVFLFQAGIAVAD